MQVRPLNTVDRLLAGLGNALRTIAAPAGKGHRANPADAIEATELDAADTRHAAGLMRVNHAGEVAAQALYLGHSVLARDRGIEAQLQQAASEEFDHLAWCEQRLAELDAAPSRLSPLWYGGAFTIGAASSLLGDKWGLGFIAETEQQVCAHLDRHLGQLPKDDLKSRAIVAQMRDEEASHGANAINAGAAELPGAVKRVMQLAARIMTTTAYRL
ncbi:MAG TPA: 2-polyprenyl-3-methyl-6-methoxy-1,4-benzoquinone monooxygenase [Woeseiaceae bacterium]|nr:2-polyprenyl-3-methyl-6-methoxy-1,4-benzoquinone monooxygenase [Woeseiaceae bacterium]